MAATRLMSLNKSKVPFLLQSMSLNPTVNNLSMAGVPATNIFSDIVEKYDNRTLVGGEKNLNEKSHFDDRLKSHFDDRLKSSSILKKSDLLDQFRVDVRGRRVISDDEAVDDKDDDDEVSDSDDSGDDDDYADDEEARLHYGGAKKDKDDY